MSEELISSAFTDEFTDFPQQVATYTPGDTSAAASITTPQAVTLIQPIQQPNPVINQSTTGGIMNEGHQQQPQSLEFGGFQQPQMIISGQPQHQQPTTQYVVQNVVAPVSFVQTSNVSGLIPVMATSNVQTMQPQHAQLVSAQGGPPRTVIITQRPMATGASGGSVAPTIINTVSPKVVTLPGGIARPILEKKSVVTVVTSAGNIANAMQQPTPQQQPILIQTSSMQQPIPQSTQARTIITSPAKVIVSGRGRGARGGATAGRGRGRGGTSTPTNSMDNTNDAKKKKDPNAPVAPLTAYKFFFKETGQTVKNHNPAAKFGDVSRIVASMWERLSDDEKAIYRKLSEDDKARYKREMLEYRESLPNEELEDSSTEDNSGGSSAVFSMTASAPSVVISNGGRPKVNPEDVTNTTCIRKGCASLAIRNAEWEDEYCSNECVVSHCKDVFADWVGGNLPEQQAV